MSKGGCSSCSGWCKDICDYAKQNPVKFFTISSFLSLGAIPLLSFLGFALTAVIASFVGAVILDAFLISAAAVGLGFVLCFVGCASLCCTSLFGICYYSFGAVKCTVGKGCKLTGFRLCQKSTWPLTAKED